MATGPTKKGYRRLIVARQPHFFAYKLIERERASVILRSNIAPGGQTGISRWSRAILMPSSMSISAMIQVTGPKQKFAYAPEILWV
jgi:hypothetical protein